MPCIVTLESARLMLDMGIASATQRRLAVCIALVDAGGNLLAFVRMDDAVPGAIDLAQRKARTSALFRTASASLGALSGPGQALWSIEQSNGGLTSFAGGLPLVDRNGNCLGAIGVSGATAAEDESIARACASALVPDISLEKKHMKQAPKRILVTGAGSGFGREVALRLAAKGHEVIAGVQITPQVTELRQLADSLDLKLRVEKLDITSARDRAYAWQWQIDVLLNNAGDAETGAIAEIPMDILRGQFETNVFANLELTQGFVRQMVERRQGKIVFVSSIAGLLTGPFTGAYCASKHALESIAEALHMELAEFGIQVATINPGPYSTGFNDRMMETWKSWYDPQKHFTDHAGLKFPFEQYDPEEMVAKMVEVVEADGGAFRNLLPAHFVEIVKHDQRDAWTRQQS